MAQNLTDVWQEVHGDLLAFIAKRVANEAAVEDILQEVFLRTHRKLDSLKDPRRVVSWLFQITRHAIIDHYRSRQLHREIPAGLANDIDSAHATSDFGEPSRAALTTFSGDSGQLRAELAGCLRPMIEKLSAHYRDTIMLVELEGLTQEAAAKRLGLSVSGVKSRLKRGRTQLKRMLDACCLIELDRRRGIVDFAVRDSSSQTCHPSSRTV